MSLRVALLSGLAVVAAASGCSRDRGTAVAEVREERTLPRAVAAWIDPPVEAVTVPVPGDLPVFVVTGRGGACPSTIFLHGMCGHGLGYVQAFQSTARDHGAP